MPDRALSTLHSRRPMATAPPPPPLPDPSATKRLTSLADVSRALADVGARERAIDARLDSLLAGRAALEARLARVAEDTAEVCGRRWIDRVAAWRTRRTMRIAGAHPPPHLHPQDLAALRTDAKTLADGIAGTAALAERVSRTVRQLDAAQSRVQETLTHIDAAVGRAEAVEGLRAALAADDYDGAAARVAAFRDLEARFVAAGAGADDRQLREQRQVMGGVVERACPAGVRRSPVVRPPFSSRRPTLSRPSGGRRRPREAAVHRPCPPGGRVPGGRPRGRRSVCAPPRPARRARRPRLVWRLPAPPGGRPRLGELQRFDGGSE